MNEETIIKEIKQFVMYLPHITTEEFSVFDEQFHGRLARINEMSLIVPEKRKLLMKYLFEACSDEIDKGIINRHIRCKPLGYPGDYQVIDWLYTQKIVSIGFGRLWDEFLHRQAASRAVRNRKEFFCKTFKELCRNSPNGLSVLNLASGPCRDVAEAIEAGTLPGTVHFHCVDVDENAIAYAKQILNGKLHDITIQWEAGNVFKIRPFHRYDLSWSAGLFDYLEDRYAIALMQRMWTWTKDRGSIIIGNFHPRNPTRNYMEWVGSWSLIHRTEEHLLSLCEQAGIPEKCVSFAHEPLGINIFCVITKA